MSEKVLMTFFDFEKLFLWKSFFDDIMTLEPREFSYSFKLLAGNTNKFHSETTQNIIFVVFKCGFRILLRIILWFE